MATITENRTITLNEASPRLIRMMKLKRPVFLWGQPGVGKSDLMQGIADSGALGKTLLKDVRIALNEPTDIKGMPYFNSNSGLMEWAPPIEMPTAEECAQYDTVVLFLDELNSAAMATQAATYQLTLNGRIGEYVLPDNVVIVAAGNRESDKGVTYRMPSSPCNRFVHFEVRVDFDSWLDWAVMNNVHPDVIGYLSFAKQDLSDFDPRSSGRSFATPRTWTFVSDVIHTSVGNEAEDTDIVAGAVGEGIALKFMAHRKIAKDMPNPGDILDGKVKELKLKEISAQYALAVGMCYELKGRYESYGKKDDVKWHKEADNFFRFMMDQFPTEMTVMAARMACVNYDLPFNPQKLSHFKEFFDRFGKYIVKAMEN